jgi:glycosyltransferase involved in cell wall biosynthesis
VSAAPRLCMIVHGAYPDVRVRREAQAAIGAGFAVEVVATRSPGEPARAVIDGVVVRRLPVSRRRGGGIAVMLREYLGFAALASAYVAATCVRRPYAVVQVHNPPDFLIVAALVPKLLGAGVVLDVHDLAADLFATRFGSGRATAAVETVLRLFERWAARAADEVITVHEPYRRVLAERGVPERKLGVVMNAADERLLPKLPAEAESGFRVVYHGTVTPAYGIELLVEAVALAAREVPEIRLEIYGQGDSMPALAALSAELGIEAHVALSAYLPQREVLARVAGAAAGVIPNPPSRYNRFALSNKLFEYVALGIPVVAADLPTIREHFPGDELLFFRAGDASELAAALVRVAADPPAAAARSASARARYDRYRWQPNAERYVETLARARRRRTKRRSSSGGSPR